MEKTIEIRRNFIKKSLGAAGIILCSGGLSTLLDSCTTPFNAAPEGTASIDLSMVTELSKDGGITEKVFTDQFNNAPIIIIRENKNKYLAFCTVCTHYGKKVSAPSNGTSDMICKAHNGHFSPVDGRVISGPPKKGLTKYLTTYDPDTNILTISDWVY